MGELLGSRAMTAAEKQRRSRALRALRAKEAQRGVDAIIVQGTEAGAIPAGSLRQPPAVRD